MIGLSGMLKFGAVAVLLITLATFGIKYESTKSKLVALNIENDKLRDDLVVLDRLIKSNEATFEKINNKLKLDLKDLQEVYDKIEDVRVDIKSRQEEKIEGITDSLSDSEFQLMINEKINGIFKEFQKVGD